MSEVMSELEITQATISDVFRAVNKSGNGKISYSEFVQASLDCNIIVQRENLEKVFKMLSKGGDTIRAAHLKEAFGQTPGIVVSDNQWNLVVQEVTQDASCGEIQLDQFCAYMKSVIAKRMQATGDYVIEEDAQ